MELELPNFREMRERYRGEILREIRKTIMLRSDIHPDMTDEIMDVFTPEFLDVIGLKALRFNSQIHLILKEEIDRAVNCIEVKKYHEKQARNSDG